MKLVGFRFDDNDLRSSVGQT